MPKNFRYVNKQSSRSVEIAAESFSAFFATETESTSELEAGFEAEEDVDGGEILFVEE